MYNPLLSFLEHMACAGECRNACEAFMTARIRNFENCSSCTCTRPVRNHSQEKSKFDWALSQAGMATLSSLGLSMINGSMLQVISARLRLWLRVRFRIRIRIVSFRFVSFRRVSFIFMWFSNVDSFHRLWCWSSIDIRVGSVFGAMFSHLCTDEFRHYISQRLNNLIPIASVPNDSEVGSRTWLF